MSTQETVRVIYSLPWERREDMIRVLSAAVGCDFGSIVFGVKDLTLLTAVLLDRASKWEKHNDAEMMRTVCDEFLLKQAKMIENFHGMMDELRATVASIAANPQAAAPGEAPHLQRNASQLSVSTQNGAAPVTPKGRQAASPQPAQRERGRAIATPRTPDPQHLVAMTSDLLSVSSKPATPSQGAATVLAGQAAAASSGDMSYAVPAPARRREQQQQQQQKQQQQQQQQQHEGARGGGVPHHRHSVAAPQHSDSPISDTLQSLIEFTQHSRSMINSPSRRG
eukprot:TRINITY_DN15910_c0_g1_i1.p1 TRINITY_DN15910_c0_g1~~TRINITY_DN15910_c0_g1_i1.p1  ORF type:complete len:281 (+),score=75.24 TRINITY_DN15910_c0_g1_i1:332-1174(+)